MKLSELKPRWIHPNIFVFLCPHCQKIWISCKNIEISSKDQFEIFRKEFEGDLLAVVPDKPEMSWSIQGSFDNLTVMPSIDASASGHWHGHISNGKIT